MKGPAIAARDREILWHPYTQMQTSGEAMVISHAKGAYLFDPEDRPYLDAISSWWVNLHGHCHPHIAAAIASQAQRLEQVIFAGFTHEPAVRLAERLLEILPSNQRRVFYTDNGSTAVEAALKMAVQYWCNRGASRFRIITLQNAYHGDTVGAMSVGERGVFNAPFAKLLFEVEAVPAPEAGREEVALEALAQCLDSGEAAAFIFEPLLQAAGGMRLHSSQGLDRMLKLCRERQVLTIADEVAVGFGRTGRLFAAEYLEEQPDMVCLSKGLTGGFMPLAVTTCTQEVFDAFLSEDRSKALMHGHSYTANPLGCAAALASLDLLEKLECQDRIREIADLQQAFVAFLAGHPKAFNPRSLGTVAAVDVGGQNGAAYLSPLRDRLCQFFLSKGVLLRPLGNVVYILPPYCITAEELRRVQQAVVEALELG